MDKLHTLYILVLIGVSQYILLASSSCNEAICASIVSKCMLTQSCKCDLKNCTCCRDCYNCLDDLYYECCSCVEMCPISNDSDVPLGKNSHVGELPEKIPDLFNALTEEQDRQLRWVAYSYPIHLDVAFFSPKLDREIKMIAVSSSSSQDVDKYEEEAINCTVAFMSQCMSWNKCKRSCTSMGASSYRWFHDGCCECVGDTCLNYGINVSKCLKCSSEEQSGDLDGANVDLSEIGENDTGSETNSNVKDTVDEQADETLNVKTVETEAEVI